MAAPTVTVTIERIETGRRYKRTTFSIRLSGTTPDYTALGETVDLTLATNPKGLPRAGFQSSALPGDEDIIAENNVIGYTATLKKNGTTPTLKNYLFRGWDGKNEITTSWPTGTYGATPADAPKFMFTVRQKNYN